MNLGVVDFIVESLVVATVVNLYGVWYRCEDIEDRIVKDIVEDVVILCDVCGNLMVLVVNVVIFFVVSLNGIWLIVEVTIIVVIFVLLDTVLVVVVEVRVVEVFVVVVEVGL